MTALATVLHIFGVGLFMLLDLVDAFLMTVLQWELKARISAGQNPEELKAALQALEEIDRNARSGGLK